MTDYQKILFPYAYNILGTVEDARDVVQDVMSKHLTSDKNNIADEQNYLIRSVINHAINVQNRNKRVISDTRVWLPEPVATDDSADRNLHLKEILSYSLMVLLEKLNATERAVFILKESFDYSHQEICEVLDITEEHSRKLLSRAKTKLFKPAVTPKRDDSHITAFLDNYIDAIRQRDTSRLESILSKDILYYADGGDKINVIARICTGAVDTAAILIKGFHLFQSRQRFEVGWVNHQPAILCWDDDTLKAVQVFELSADGTTILQLNNIVDPGKLKNLAS
jgi:RNA polymerase sigma factor (sigma-70 family)